MDCGNKDSNFHTKIGVGLLKQVAGEARKKILFLIPPKAPSSWWPANDAPKSCGPLLVQSWIYRGWAYSPVSDNFPEFTKIFIFCKYNTVLATERL